MAHPLHRVAGDFQKAVLLKDFQTSQFSGLPLADKRESFAAKPVAANVPATIQRSASPSSSKETALSLCGLALLPILTQTSPNAAVRLSPVHSSWVVRYYYVERVRRRPVRNRPNAKRYIRRIAKRIWDISRPFPPAIGIAGVSIRLGTGLQGNRRRDG